MAEIQVASFELRGAPLLSDKDAEQLAKKLWGRRVGGVILAGKARGVLRISNRVKSYIPELDEWIHQTQKTLTTKYKRAELDDRWIAKLIVPA